MKIAFTSKTGEIIDRAFRHVDSFHVWEIGPGEAHYLETVTVGSHGDDEEDRIGARADVLMTAPSFTPCRSVGRRQPSWWRGKSIR